MTAACTSDEAPAASTVAPTSPPATTTSTTAAPLPTTMAPPEPPPPTTTTTAPGLTAQVLRPGLTPGTLVGYAGTRETRVGWSGPGAALLFADDLASEGAVVTELAGTQRLLALDAGATVEVVADFVAESGAVTSEIDGEQVRRDLTRDQVLDYKPATPPIVLDDRWRPVSNTTSGAPHGLVSQYDLLSTAALLGPPLSNEAVDVGDVWTYTQQDPLLGPLTVEAEVVEEVRGDDGTYVFVIDFSGTAEDLPLAVDPGEVAVLAESYTDGSNLLEDFVPAGTAASATVRSATVDGSIRFDPASGLAVAVESLLTFGLDFEVPAEGAALEPLSIDLATIRSASLAGHGPASPFDVSSVLDRFEIDAEELAHRALWGVTRYDLADSPAETTDPIFDTLVDLREDLIAGSAAVDAFAGSGAVTTVLALTLAGEFRGAPFVAEEVARFLSGTNPVRVGIGDHTAYRVPIDGGEWLLYNNESHLFIAVGPRDMARQALTEVARTTGSYLWQAGDCLDFTDGFDDATPYAPFGFHGMRHCAVAHTHEVIYSEVLPEGPDASFPSDLSTRSEATCGRAFYEFTGTSELETSLALIRYLPDREEWAKGARYFACVVFETGPSGTVEVRGRIDGRDPDLAFDLGVGTCLADLYPVACEFPHNGEIIAVFDLPQPAGTPRPDVTTLRNDIADRCRRELEALSLRPGPGSVEVFDLTDAIGAWDFGARRVYCRAVAFGVDGTPLQITGTFGGGWREADDFVTA